MIIGIGTDIVSITRISAAYERQDAAFTKQLLSASELIEFNAGEALGRQGSVRQSGRNGHTRASDARWHWRRSRLAWASFFRTSTRRTDLSENERRHAHPSQYFRRTRTRHRVRSF